MKYAFLRQTLAFGGSGMPVCTALFCCWLELLGWMPFGMPQLAYIVL